MMTTIQLDSKIKRKLDLLKIHKRETYNELLGRILENCSSSKFDKEDLIETIEVLSDPQTMKNISEALSEINNKEKWVSFEHIKKENGL